MHSLLPKYIQLMETIKGDIQRQILVPNEQLPNEDELAAKYKMSRGTVRKAISELQLQGFVRKEQGRGTFVNEPKPALNGFSLVEFDQYVQSQNRTLQTSTLHFEVLDATTSIAEKLQIDADAPVIHIVQVRYADDMPLVYEERFLDYNLCPTLTQDEIEQYSIHWLLVEKYQIPLVRLEHTIEIITLPEEKFEVFAVDDAVSVFAVDRLSFTKTNEKIHPAVWYQALYRADEYQFQAQFHTSI